MATDSFGFESARHKSLYIKSDTIESNSRRLDVVPEMPRLIIQDSIRNQTLPDSIMTPAIASDSLNLELGADSLTVASDSLKTDKKPIIEAPIEYHAKDSLIFSIDGQEVYLYGDAEVKYQQMDLKAAYIVLNLESKEIFAEGVPDSTGVLQGKPIFKDGKEEFESKTLRYNFQTQKGIITEVVTAQGEGLVRSDRAKKISKDEFIMVKGKYTTCDADHPHFYMHLSKAKVVSNNKIITGPAYMVLEDFPLYFPFLPFGYFPSTPRYSSGIIIPSYGEEANRGFFLREGGYYWAASQYFDLAVLGDIYTKGSWGARARTNYKVRYKFSGNMSFNYAKNIYGEKGTDTEQKSKQFQFTWSHTQDPKANPSRTFSANVNLSSSGYDKQSNTFNSQNYLQTQKSSNVSFTKNWENTPFTLNVSLRHSQNNTDSSMSLVLPTLSFNVGKVYPLKKKNRSGPAKWYEKFGFGYSVNMQNSITAREDEIMKKSLITDWKNGIQHNTPITLPNFNLIKYINVTPSISYSERWYFKHIKKSYNPDEIYQDAYGRNTHVLTDTITGFKRAYNYSYSVGTSTNIYGTFIPLNPKSKIKGIRHKMTPSISFSYTPDFGAKRFGFWDVVQTDTLGTMTHYSIFDGAVYGYPGRGASGSVGFSLTNSLEMKVIDSADTTSTNVKYKKVKIIDNLSLSGSYNLIADSLNMSTISIRGRTTIKGVGINFGTTVDPYMTNDKGQRIHQYAWNARQGLGKLGRLTNANFSFGMQFNSKDKRGGDTGAPGGEGLSHGEEGHAGGEHDHGPALTPYDPNIEYADFNVPWTFGFDYSFSYTRSNPYLKGKIVQTLNLRGSLNLTSKWRLSANTNFDFTAGQFSYTNFSVHRDLHCWEMSLSFVPFGYAKSYSFTLSAKTSMLRDLKINKQKSHYDNFGAD